MKPGLSLEDALEFSRGYDPAKLPEKPLELWACEYCLRKCQEGLVETIDWQVLGTCTGHLSSTLLVSAFDMGDMGFCYQTPSLFQIVDCSIRSCVCNALGSLGGDRVHIDEGSIQQAPREASREELELKVEDIRVLQEQRVSEACSVVFY